MVPQFPYSHSICIQNISRIFEKPPNCLKIAVPMNFRSRYEIFPKWPNKKVLLLRFGLCTSSANSSTNCQRPKLYLWSEITLWVLIANATERLNNACESEGKRTNWKDTKKLSYLLINVSFQFRSNEPQGNPPLHYTLLPATQLSLSLQSLIQKYTCISIYSNIDANVTVSNK